jgi:23S rRNA (adenine2503-C2)-methyltransferase
VHQKYARSFEEMTDLPVSLRSKLSEYFYFPECRVISEQKSFDGTRKWLFLTDSGSSVEAVYIPEPQRRTLCVSSQVGCELNCRFCHTATQGFERNLSAGEIVSQLWFVNRFLRQENLPLISNVVFMGMGEPLRNLDAVLPALELMLSDYAYGLSKRRVTVSTSGVVPGIEALAERLDVAFALSLHAPDNSTRDQIVPLNKKYPLEVLLPAVQRYLDTFDRKNHVTLEYVMLKDVNDSEKQARQLGNLIHKYFSGRAKLNLIPFNTFPTTQFQSSSQEHIQHFAQILRDKGILTTIRKTRGPDILGACGQLAGDVLDKTRRRQRYLQELASAQQPVTHYDTLEDAHIRNV